MSKTKRPQLDTLPDDPRDYYITQRTLSVEALAQIYKGEGKSQVKTLRRRCAEEDWKGLRKKWLEKTSQRTLEKTTALVSTWRAKTLSELNEKHDKRLDKLYTLNNIIMKQHITRFVDSEGKEVMGFTMNPTDFRKITQNEIELMSFERLVNNHPVREPSDVVEKSEVDHKMVSALIESAKRDWGLNASKEQPRD